MRLAAEDGDTEESSAQSIDDVLLYVKHSDPLLRGSTYVLIGTLIESMLRSRMSSDEFYEARIDELTRLLIQVCFNCCTANSIADSVF